MGRSVDAGLLDGPGIGLMEKLRVGIRTSGHFVVASEHFEVGQLICLLDGTISSTATRYSIQIGPDEHLSPSTELDEIRAGGPSAWVFTNHSCQPNAVLVGRDLVALKIIKQDEEVTIDYEVTESVMAEPFHCLCGSPNCRKYIGGYLVVDQTASQGIVSSESPPSDDHQLQGQY